MRLCASGGVFCLDFKSLLYLLISLVKLYLGAYVHVLERNMMHINIAKTSIFNHLIMLCSLVIF